MADALDALTTVGIIGALPDEIAKLELHVQEKRRVQIHPTLTVTEGTISHPDAPKRVCFCAGGVGLVATAAAATVLLERFSCGSIIFTGVAGALVSDLAVGDIMICEDVVHWDLNCSAWSDPAHPKHVHSRGELPFTSGLSAFPSDPRLVQLAQDAASWTARCGRLVSGSEFLSAERKADLAPVWLEIGGSPQAVDMECVAAAQVCRAYGRPFLGLRAISDTTEGDASADFNAFAAAAADRLWPIVEYVATRM